MSVYFCVHVCVHGLCMYNLCLYLCHMCLSACVSVFVCMSMCVVCVSVWLYVFVCVCVCVQDPGQEQKAGNPISWYLNVPQSSWTWSGQHTTAGWHGVGQASSQ